MAEGVPLTDVLSVMCGGGVEVREGSGGARATMVAIVPDERSRLLARLICSGMMQLVTSSIYKSYLQRPGECEGVRKDSRCRDGVGQWARMGRDSRAMLCNVISTSAEACKEWEHSSSLFGKVSNGGLIGIACWEDIL